MRCTVRDASHEAWARYPRHDHAPDAGGHRRNPVRKERWQADDASSFARDRPGDGVEHLQVAAFVLVRIAQLDDHRQLSRRLDRFVAVVVVPVKMTVPAVVLHIMW